MSKGAVALIGGTGFIGRCIARRWEELGHPLILISRSAGQQTARPGRQYRSASMGDAASMRRALEGAWLVYDLTYSTGQTWEEVRRETVDAALNVAQVCRETGVARFIYTSSISALYLGGRGVLRDEDGCDPQVEARDFYGRSKIESEHALLDYCQREKLSLVIFRPGVVMGAGGQLMHGAVGDRIGETGFLGYGSGNHPLPCVLVEDVAAAMVTAGSVTGIDNLAFNLAGDVRPTAREYVEELSRRSHRNFQYYPRSVWMIQASQHLRYGAKVLLRKSDRRPEFVRDTSSMSMARQLDCSRAKQLLNWKPVAEREEFFRQAIDANLPPLAAGDLRTRPLRGGARPFFYCG